MVPKAFPYPLGIGVDVCRVSRVAHLLQKQNLCNRWARKVFTRLEWSALWNHVKKAQLMAAADTWKGNGIDMTITPGEQTSCSRNDPPTDNSIWMLPELPERSLSRRSSIQSKVADNGADFDGRSPIELLARHLAGRYGIPISPRYQQTFDRFPMLGGLQKKLSSKHIPTVAFTCVRSPSLIQVSTLACFLRDLPKRAKSLPWLTPW